MDPDLFDYFCKTANYEYMPIMVTRDSAKPTLQAVRDASRQTRVGETVGDILGGGVLGGTLGAAAAIMPAEMVADLASTHLSPRGLGMMADIGRTAVPVAAGAAILAPAIGAGMLAGSTALGGLGTLMRHRREGRLQEWIDAKG